MLESLDIQQALLLEISSWVGLDWGMTAWCLQYDTSSVVHPGLIGCFGLLLQYKLTRGWPTTGWSDLVCVLHWRLHEVTLEPIQSPAASASQWLLLSAAVARSLMVFRWACPLIPTSFNSLVVELATKTLQPTSTGRTFTFHPRSSASAAKSAYR